MLAQFTLAPLALQFEVLRGQLRQHLARHHTVAGPHVRLLQKAIRRSDHRPLHRTLEPGWSADPPGQGQRQQDRGDHDADGPGTDAPARFRKPSAQRVAKAQVPGCLRGPLEFEHRTGEAGDVLAQRNLVRCEKGARGALQRDGATDAATTDDRYAAGLPGPRQLPMGKTDWGRSHRRRPGHAQTLVHGLVHRRGDPDSHFLALVELGRLRTGNQAEPVALQQADADPVARQQLRQFDRQRRCRLGQSVPGEQRRLAAQDGVLGG